MRKVNPRTQTPVFATILILVIGVVLMLALPGQALLQLILGSTILPALIYGAIVVLYLAVRERLESKEGAFNLGRFDLPVAVAALVWIVLALFVLVTPDDALIPSLIVIGLILVGGVYFAWMMIFNREVLDAERSTPFPTRRADGSVCGQDALQRRVHAGVWACAGWSACARLSWRIVHELETDAVVVLDERGVVPVVEARVHLRFTDRRPACAERDRMQTIDLRPRIHGEARCCHPTRPCRCGPVPASRAGNRISSGSPSRLPGDRRRPRRAE